MTGLEKTDIYRVECPNCGVPEGGMCEETGAFGRTGTYRSPHPERRELAAEIKDEQTDE